ncbi:hypothetical protein NKY66_00075 [Sinorhizobium meliloti]|uniref:hypothetical protein n=1 Tax=Rhizobium meliloti TaxID=382 RepID=UPI000FD6CC6A|nr:hypothetical protein [Sinorhizobium meliloti]MDW9417111.1 hypothetical protein [Sinorhizobium meliloti]MDW9480456.1 hypothetical protein [Sinorhizobium meliloti]MDW9513934.1 hypothetical protein [Sinorhizobium meliloti]MQW10083.1 hypothetical protein [Sinorhizobium meliloti]RVG74256.1 hypothetical protein CN220_05675 [Sinorhizobium meliloti]
MNVAKLIAALSCMVASGWVGYSYHAGDVTFEPILAVLAALAWLFTEYKDGSQKPVPALHPHDVALGLRLKGLFNEPTKIFLREHSFGQAYPHSKLHAVRDVSYWEGSEYEFENSELDNISSEIVRLSDELYGKLAGYAGPIDRPEGYFAVPLDHERAQDRFGEETSARIAEVNELARQIVQQLELFEKAFRRLSPESYSAQPRTATVSAEGPRIL